MTIPKSLKRGLAKACKEYWDSYKEENVVDKDGFIICPVCKQSDVWGLRSGTEANTWVFGCHSNNYSCFRYGKGFVVKMKTGYKIGHHWTWYEFDPPIGWIRNGHAKTNRWYRAP